VQSLTNPAAGLIRVEAPDALARELETLSTDMRAAVELHDAKWGISFGVDGAEALAAIARTIVIFPTADE